MSRSGTCHHVGVPSRSDLCLTLEEFDLYLSKGLGESFSQDGFFNSKEALHYLNSKIQI